MSDVVDRIVVGRFGKVHGIKGLITVISFTEPRDNILRYSNWHALINHQWQALNITRTEVTDKHILVQVEGYTEREQAASLTNIEIGIRRDQLPELEEGDYYWHQLCGLQVINQQGDVLGKVLEIMPTGSNDVLVVQGESRMLIPYLPGRFVLSVDTDKGQIVVDWDPDF
ncbi:ribosome maturation factor RimM [Legionella sp. CNM-4043-24]|uniref:ribosome maturation factor RimM n=1 Tax=Legionella sp. CNM-4043-24 TaxID=3421646 RepID=UPI00403AFFDE